MMKNFINKHWKLILVAFLTLIFLLLAGNLESHTLDNFDKSIYNFIQLSHCSFMTLFFKIITFLASSAFLIILCILILLFNKKKKDSILIVFNLVNTVIINVVLKQIFSRERPIDLMLIEESGFSFPSGHSMAAMTFYGFIIYLIWQNKWKKKNKVISSVLLSLLIVLIGTSRIYLGVHYASDVLAGFIISLIYLILYTFIVSKYKLMKSDKQPIWKSFGYAFSGIKTNLLTERNLLIHVCFMALVIVAGFALKISVLEWLICIILFGLVISLELVNTAIEVVVDICMPDINPKAKLAKDTAAGAVLISAISAAIIGLIIFLPKIINLWR